jgi:HK97 gp10 family phage protein
MVTNVQGVDRLTKKLHQLPDAYQKEIFLAFEKGAQETVNLARGLAPQDQGDLKASIGWGWGDPGSRDRGAPKPGGSDQNKVLSIYAGDRKAYYARWVEFGTIGRPAQPFFYPAWRTVRKRVQAGNKRAMVKVARKVAAGGN